MLDPYELAEPTGEELARHVARYGRAGVPKNLRVRKAKTAEGLAAASRDRDLQAVAKKRDARKNARRPTVKAEVAELLARQPATRLVSAPECSGTSAGSALPATAEERLANHAPRVGKRSHDKSRSDQLPRVDALERTDRNGAER